MFSDASLRFVDAVKTQTALGEAGREDAPVRSEQSGFKVDRRVIPAVAKRRAGIQEHSTRRTLFMDSGSPFSRPE
jgi:hypothetical protein